MLTVRVEGVKQADNITNLDQPMCDNKDLRTPLRPINNTSS